MSGSSGLVDRDTVRRAVAAAYCAAGLERSYAASAVAPLKKLVAAYPLTWYEVPGLKETTAAMHLHIKLGVPVDEVSGHDNDLAGRLYATQVGGCILVEQKHPLVRRRFTVAHELGHYVLHVLPRLADGATVFTEQLLRTEGEQDQDDAPAGYPMMIGNSGQVVLIDAAQAEKEADLFAAEILMPEPLCRSLVEANLRRCRGKGQVLARLLATECLVSELAMIRRLEELNLSVVAA